MYNLNDTIIAVSSPSTDKRVIVRITGPQTEDTITALLAKSLPENQPGVFATRIRIDDQLSIDAQLYLFLPPRSYTGEAVAELHLFTNPSVVEKLMQNCFARGLRMAGPGEFTARAYLNGKIDLAQAEAVNECIITTNHFQLSAAQQVLSGGLATATEKITNAILGTLSLIETNLDFSGEDIPFQNKDATLEQLNQIETKIEALLSGRCRNETLIELPSIGIAGAPNAGKSSLLNRLLGEERSIVSGQRKTTRDVLTGILNLPHHKTVLFDCAGLITQLDNILDQLAQRAAVEALKSAAVVIFCVDATKDDWHEDLEIQKLIESDSVIPVATKIDLLDNNQQNAKLKTLSELFSCNFSLVSNETAEGIESLIKTLDAELLRTLGASEKQQPAKTDGTQYFVALTARHQNAAEQALEDIQNATLEIQNNQEEVAAMMLRSAYQTMQNIEQEHVDEKILDNIFSRFCIGK